MKVSHHQIELPLFCILKIVKYHHFITKLASNPTQMNAFLGVYDPIKHIRRHLMVLTGSIFHQPSPKSRLLLPVEFCSDSILPEGWGKKKKVKNQLIYGIFELLTPRC